MLLLLFLLRVEDDEGFKMFAGAGLTRTGPEGSADGESCFESRFRDCLDFLVVGCLEA